MKTPLNSFPPPPLLVVTLRTTVASADVSYNIGYVSEYYYRGIYQRIPLPALESTTKKAVSM